MCWDHGAICTVRGWGWGAVLVDDACVAGAANNTAHLVLLLFLSQTGLSSPLPYPLLPSLRFFPLCPSAHPTTTDMRASKQLHTFTPSRKCT